MRIENAIGFGIVFLALIAMTDIPATQQIASGFAVLILIAIALLYGPIAFKKVTAINTGKTKLPSDSTSDFKDAGDNTARGLA